MHITHCNLNKTRTRFPLLPAFSPCPAASFLWRSTRFTLLIPISNITSLTQPEPAAHCIVRWRHLNPLPEHCLAECHHATPSANLRRHKYRVERTRPNSLLHLSVSPFLFSCNDWLYHNSLLPSRSAVENVQVYHIPRTPITGQP